MKTVDLASAAPSVDQLLLMASRDNVILRTAEGREYLLAKLEDVDEEIELIRQNDELMQLLDKRSHEAKRYSIAQVREILEKEAGGDGESNHQSRV